MYTEQERRIFGPYFNGTEVVYADPIRLKRRLDHALEGETPKWIERYNDPAHPQHYDAQERVLAAAVWAMELRPFNPQTGEGVLEAEVEQALYGFLEYLEGKGPRAESTPTSSTPSEDLQVGSVMTPPAGYLTDFSCRSG
jgi:hypothetical protein